MYNASLIRLLKLDLYPLPIIWKSFSHTLRCRVSFACINRCDLLSVLLCSVALTPSLRLVSPIYSLINCHSIIRYLYPTLDWIVLQEYIAMQWIHYSVTLTNVTSICQRFRLDVLKMTNGFLVEISILKYETRSQSLVYCLKKYHKPQVIFVDSNVILQCLLYYQKCNFNINHNII